MVSIRQGMLIDPVPPPTGVTLSNRADTRLIWLLRLMAWAKSRSWQEP